MYRFELMVIQSRVDQLFRKLEADSGLKKTLIELLLIFEKIMDRLCGCHVCEDC